jgi:hypothetical protein
MPGIIEVMDVVLASGNQRLYRAAITTTEDIADLVGDRHYESLTTAPGYQFWFAASAGRLNGPATKLLFTHQGLPPQATPLLRGHVVVTRRTAAGGPAGLSAEQICALLAPLEAIGHRHELAIERRLNRAANTDLRARHRKQMESTTFKMSRSARFQANWRVLRYQLSPNNRW